MVDPDKIVAVAVVPIVYTCDPNLPTPEDIVNILLDVYVGRGGKIRGRGVACAFAHQFNDLRSADTAQNQADNQKKQINARFAASLTHGCAPPQTPKNRCSRGEIVHFCTGTIK